MRSVRSYLLALVAICILLATLAFAIIVNGASQFSRRQAEGQALETANVLSQAVDRELERSIGLLTALRNSGAANRGDWDALDRQARAAVSGPDVWVLVQDRSGRQLVNTRLADRSSLQRGPVPAQMWREIADGKPRICDLSRGVIEPNIVCVDAGIGGRNPPFAISMIFRPHFFDSIVRREGVGDGAIATLVDRQARIIWRNRGSDQFVGRTATGQMLDNIRARAASGVLESTSLEDVRVLSAFHRSPLSGWSVIVGTPLQQIEGGITNAYWRGIALALAVLVLGCAVAVFIAGRLANAMKELALVHEGGGSGRATGIREIDQAAAALTKAAAARSESEANYRRIFEQSSDLILTADLDQVLTDANPAAAEAVGVPIDELIGRKISDFVSPEDYERTSAMLRQKLEDGGTTRYDVRVRNVNGEWLFWEINSGLTFDDNGVPVGLHVVGRDVTERKRAERQNEILVGELNHRVKNTLAVVQSLAHQTFHHDKDVKVAKAAFEGRLQAMAAAHNLLTRQLWAFASMTELVELSLAPFCIPGRCKVEGTDFKLAPQAAVSISLAIHELATNAIKYGALSSAHGEVTVSWAWEGDTFNFEWRERDGPAVTPPSRQGFGMRLIQRSLAAELGGKVEVDFDANGLVCRITSSDSKLARLEPAI